jgi:hypothetical protein
MNRDWVDYSLAFIQAASLIALVVYVVKTWEMASATRRAAEVSAASLQETRDARDQEIAPYVTVYFDIPYGASLIYLVVKNIGKTVAGNVKIEFDPPLKRSTGEPINKLPVEADVMGSFAPGYEVRSLFDSTVSYLNQADLPSTYKATITYEGGLYSTSRQLVQHIDLAIHKGMHYTLVKDTSHVVRELEKLTRSTDKITDQLDRVADSLSNGIWVQGTSPPLRDGESDGVSWRSTVSNSLRELKTLWSSIYESERESVSSWHISNMKGRSSIIRTQLAIAVSNPPAAIRSQLVEAVLNVTLKLFELDRPRTSFLTFGEEQMLHEYALELNRLVELCLQELQTSLEKRAPQLKQVRHTKVVRIKASEPQQDDTSKGS